MTIQAQTPDGVIHQFPDGTPDAAVDKAIKGYLSQQSSAPAANESWVDKAVRIGKQAFGDASQVYRADMQKSLQTHSLIDQGKTVLDAAAAAAAPIKGIADATFGDQPIHLPASIAGIPVPQALQNINSKGLTGGDIAQVAAGGVGEISRASAVAQAAADAGTTARTAAATLDASKAPTSVMRPAINALANKPEGTAPQGNALATGMPRGAVVAVKGDPVATVEALRGAKSAAYQAVDNSGVQYTPDAFRSMVQDISKAATDQNISPERHPKATSMIADFQDMAAQGKSPTLTQLDQLRQVVRRDVAASSDSAEAHFGKSIIDGIDNFVQGAQPNDVVGGNSGAANDLVTAARTANGQYRKAEALSDALESAKLRAQSTGSGGNVDNAIRQNVRRVLENTPNLTNDEKDALTSIVAGDKLQNTLRFAGKASPATGGLNSLLTIGATTATHGALGVPLMAATGAKVAADAITTAKVNDALDLIAAGGSRANLKAVKAWKKNLAQAQANGPAAVSSALGRLRVQMRSNPALAPLYASATGLGRGAAPTPAAADTNQGQ